MDGYLLHVEKKLGVPQLTVVWRGSPARRGLGNFGACIEMSSRTRPTLFDLC